MGAQGDIRELLAQQGRTGLRGEAQGRHRLNRAAKAAGDGLIQQVMDLGQ